MKRENPFYQSQGSRSTWLASYLDEHLPHNKRGNYADLSTAFESLDCSRKKSKRRFKSRAAVGSAFRAKDKLTKINLDSKSRFLYFNNQNVNCSL